jgi:hypothetical protein
VADPLTLDAATIRAVPPSSSPRFGTTFRKTATWFRRGKAEIRLPSQPAQADAVRPLDRLVALQRADGSWDLTSDLADVLGRPLAELDKMIPAAGGDPTSARRAWATALALAWLEARPELEHEWEMLADKARDWLGRVAAAGRDDLDRRRAPRLRGHLADSDYQ